MRTTLILNDEVYRGAKVLAAERGCTVASVIEDGLRLLLAARGAEADAPPEDMPIASGMTWVRPGVPIDDTSALLELLEGPGHDALP